MGTKRFKRAGTLSIPVLAVITSTLCAVALILAFTFLFRTNAEIVHGKNSTESISFNKDTENPEHDGADKSKESDQNADSDAQKPVEHLVRPAPGNAIEGSEFKAPSGNISCKFSDGVSCTIYEYTFKAPDACKNQPLTFTINNDGTSTSCATRIGSQVELAYGGSIKSGGFACSVSEAGVDCWSEKTGDGFTIARETASHSQN